MTSIRKNLTYNIFYQVLQIILPLITAPYISRVLGSEAIGIYAYTASVGNYFVLFAMLGIANHGNRSIALNKEHLCQEKVFNEIYTIQLFTASISLLFFVCFCFISKFDNKYILYFQLLHVCSAIFDVNWLFWGLEEFRITVVRNTIIKVISAACIFVFVKNQEHLSIYALIITSSSLISQLILWVNAKRHFRFKICKIDDIKGHIKPILILFIPIIAYSIYKIMDKIMLGQMTSMEQVGYYESAERFINIPIGFITAFGTVMMPRISALVSADDNGRIENYNKLSFKYFTIIIIAISFGLIGISNVLAPVFYGAEFIYSSKIISILSLSLFFITWSNIIRTQYLIPQKNDKPYVVSTIVGACINLVINFLLIPIMGSEGAAVGTVFAEGSVFFAQVILIRKEYRVIKTILRTGRFFLYGILMCAIVRVIGMNNSTCILTLLEQIIVGAFFFMTLVLVDFIISKDTLFNNLTHPNCSIKKNIDKKKES